MNSAVAITSSIGQTAVWIAGIWTGGRIVLAALPQLRMSPPKQKQDGAQ